MKDFLYIPAILDLLLANPGISDKWKIRGWFCTRKIFWKQRKKKENLFPETEKRIGGKFFGEDVSRGKGVRISQFCLDSGISGIVQLPGYRRNEGFSKYFRNPWFLFSNSRNSGQINDFGEISTRKAFWKQKLPPRSFSQKPKNILNREKTYRGKCFSGEMLLGKKVSVVSRLFVQIPRNDGFPWF